MTPSSFFQYPSKGDSTRHPSTSRSPSTSSLPSSPTHTRRFGNSSSSSSFSLSAARPRIFNTRAHRHRSLPPQSPTAILLSLPSTCDLPISYRSTRRNITKEKIMFEAKNEMSATIAQMAASLKVEIKVVFDQAGRVSPNQGGTVDMLGGANTSSRYSLPGHVIISIPALPSGQGNKLREIRELKLVVEGKSEFWDDAGRYNPVRLYTETIDLADAKPLLIPSCDPLLPSCKTIELAVAFDLRLPGWLPPSHRAFLTNTEYGLVVQSKIGWTEAAAEVYGQAKAGDKCVATRSLRRQATLLSHVATMEEKYTSPYQTFSIHRHRLPSALNHRIKNSTEKSYNVTPAADSTSPIECIVTVPEWVDCYGRERDLRIGIRVRARKGAILAQNKSHEDDLSRHLTDALGDFTGPWTAPGTGTGEVPTPPQSGSTTPNGSPPTSSIPMQRHKKDDEVLTRIIELGMEVEEVESYSSVVAPGFKAVYPIPEESEQPSRHSSHGAFISPRSPRADAPCTSDEVFRGQRSRKCLLAEDGTQRNFFFDNNGLAMNEGWRKVNVVLPMPVGNKGLKTRPQGEMDGPMVRIRHALKIRVVCRNVGSNNEDMAVVLSVPIRFGTCPETIAATCLYRKPLLPAYIQLYHENGEQLPCDPLPIYNLTDPTTPPPSYTPTYRITSPAPSGPSRSSSPHAHAIARLSTPEVDILDFQSPSASSSDDGHGPASGMTARPPLRVLQPWGRPSPAAKCQPVPLVSAA